MQKHAAYASIFGQQVEHCLHDGSMPEQSCKSACGAIDDEARLMAVWYSKVAVEHVVPARMKLG
eukprot:6475767-Amphidinium_carterae.1